MTGAVPPNVVVIMSDQHNPRILGCAGDPVVRTPNLDGLGAGGTRFSNAHAAYPLCAPSRMAFMTARHPHELGFYTNGCQLRSDVPTFAHAFYGGGYRTPLAGKMHFTGADQHHGFTEVLTGEPAPWILNASSNAFGSTKTSSAPGQSELLGDLTRANMVPVTGALEASGPGRTGYLAYDEMVTDVTVDWLRRAARDSATPFLLTVGYLAPHNPYVAPLELYEIYRDVELPEIDQTPSGHPANAELQRFLGLDAEVPADWTGRARRAYYALCTFLDNQVGRVLNALTANGLRDNTIVVYTSDHGEHLGSHGLWFKSSFFQDSIGVPLIVAGPIGSDWVDHTARNVSLNDIGPTLLDLCGLPPLPGASGRSFRDLLHGDDSCWPDEVHAENIQVGDDWPPANGTPALAEQHTARGRVQRMVRRGRWKLCYYHGYAPQLFDLVDDPHEQNDRAHDPKCQPILRSLLTAVPADGWSPERIASEAASKPAALGLIAVWDQAFLPEPEMWYRDRLPLENHLLEDP